jgi:hypothetical protein
MTPTSSAHGTLRLDFVDNDSIVDPTGVALGGTGTGNGNFVGQAYTISRDDYHGPFLFYRESTRYYTTGKPQAQLPIRDDNAIATDKAAYRPGSGPATFTNVSGYSKGINGLMIDIAGSHPSITAADFIFRVGNNNTPSSWATAPAPLSVSVRAGAGVDGSDRVEIIWANSAIAKTWLQVITLANANTGLSQKPGYPAGEADVFFFGNAVGNSGLGDTATNATVNATDEIGVRNNAANLAANIPITNIYDYDRNGQVNAADQIASRNNATNPTTVLKYLNIGSPPLAPHDDESSGDADSPVAAFALTMADEDASPLNAIGSGNGASLSANSPTGERSIAASVEFLSHWLTFVDEQLLELLATGQSLSSARRRR